MTQRTYASPEAFKQALEQRLRSSAKTGAEFARKRQLLVFDRFLARIVAVLGDGATLKGGLVLELRLDRARTTKDVDLRMVGSPEDVLAKLQEAGRKNLGEFMAFEIGPDDDHPEIQNDGMQYDGLRFRAECKLAGRLYGQPFGVDVAFGDPILGEPEVVVAEDVLAFAGIAPPTLRLYPIETHIAEKLHAYTMPRPYPNSRVKDLPDIALLATAQPIDAKRLRAALEQTFTFRKTHALPANVPAPLGAWTTPYAAMAREDQLSWLTLDDVTRAAQTFLDPVLAGQLDATWEARDVELATSLNTRESNDIGGCCLFPKHSTPTDLTRRLPSSLGHYQSCSSSRLHATTGRVRCAAHHASSACQPLVRCGQGSAPAYIRRMARENRLWGAERIRGELLKLSIRVSKRTIQRHLRTPRPPGGGQSWRTFLQNHTVWACDFLQLHDVWFLPLFAFFIVDVNTKRVVHVGVTRSPNRSWVAHQLRNATAFGDGPQFIIRDRDSKFGAEFDRVARGVGSRVIKCPVRSPLVNANCERFLGSVRRLLQRESTPPGVEATDSSRTGGIPGRRDWHGHRDSDPRRAPSRLPESGVTFRDTLRR